MLDVRVQLTINGRPLVIAMSVPPGRVTLGQLLPALWQAGETLIADGIKTVVAQGKTISCRKGCGHCCRQPVPIAPAEARALKRLVDAMPAERRDKIRRRFAAAIREFEEAGIAEELRMRGFWERGHGREVGLRYLALRIDCPFLEDESCTIYPDRPLACREYMVTTPADNCQDPSAHTVETVDIPAGPVWPAIGRLEQDEDEKLKWVPLILALEYAAEEPDDPPAQDSRMLLERFMARIARKRGGDAADPRPSGT
ncbi:MAG: YkgJ family cysteine cluster protein [Tepidisphaerales bacterium]